MQYSVFMRTILSIRFLAPCKTPQSMAAPSPSATVTVVKWLHRAEAAPTDQASLSDLVKRRVSIYRVIYYVGLLF